MVRNGLKALLERDDELEVIAEAANGMELIELLEVKKLIPDIILLDLDMPVMDGNKTLQKIREKNADLKIIIVSTFSEGCLLNDYKEKGANAYLIKDSETKVMTDTIKRVHFLEGYTNLTEAAKSIFTKGEIKVIPLLLKGNTSDQIAEILHLARKTVEEYRDRLYEKTGTKNAAEFSGYCGRFGLEFLGGAS